MKALTQRLLLVAVSAFLVVGCEGDDGTNGTDGAVGATGADGADGATGFSCWDLNENGVADADEDLNGDGSINTLDCREPLPGEDIAVSGKVSTPAGPLDRFTSVWFVPAGGGEAVAAVIAIDGSYTAELDEGDYDGYAARPGYEDVMAAFSVTQAGPNTLDFSLPEIPDGEYITSEQCGICHTVEYASFIQTGHPFKLNKVVNNEQPIYPFTSLNGVLERIMDDGADIEGGLPDTNGIVTDNPLGTPATWADVSYVIGGYFWKARFVDQNGSIVTGSNVQYNFQNDTMTAYHNNEDDKNYNCGNCHTTGWVHTDDVLNPVGQDGLEFLQGTFSEGGIHCEACHAAGASHAKLRGGIVRNAVPRSLIELTADDAGYGLAVDCGECHTRDGERDYDTYLSGYDKALAAADPPVADPRPNEMGGRIAASGGLIRHHEQYDEILGIDPDTLDTVRSAAFLSTHGNCMTCHNPHGSSVNVDNPLYTGMPGVDPSNDACLVCHGNPDDNYDPMARAGLGMRDLLCSDCHMPDLAKSAVAIAGAEDRPAVGDVSSHIFSIALDSEQPQFTADGKFAYPAVDEDWACRTCHNNSDTGISFAVPDGPFIDNYVFHDNIID